MFEELKEYVCKANKMLPEQGLVKFTWGNVSAVDRENNIVVIKPSGMDYGRMKAEDMVVVSLDDKKIVEGKLSPSVDLDTHIEMYRMFPQMNAIVHTHSKWATIWAQAKKNIPALGTTHADEFYGEICCTREMREEEIRENYETNTGRVIVETLKEKEIYESGAVLVASHGPFVWGKNPVNAVEVAAVLEEVAEMALHTHTLSENRGENMQKVLLDKHFLRKHGKDSYYGQK